MRAPSTPPEDLRVDTFQVGRHRYVVCSYGGSNVSFPFGLSEAEWLVALLLIAGHSNAQVAEMRGVSVRTVANQVNAVFRKVGVHGRRELAAAWGAGTIGRPEPPGLDEDPAPR